MITTRIVNGIVYQNPMSNLGPYINQWAPVRRATLLERLRYMFGVAPKRSEGVTE